MSKETVLRLRANNLHLKNIFTDDYYVELGSIDIPVIERILKKEMIKIDEVAYFPIQNKGLGRSNQTDERLRNILPYLYFNNVNAKNGSKQLFITYGVLKYKNNEKEEIFIPVVLLPVKLYFENDQVYLQLISKPIENPFLLKIFNDNNKNSEFVAEKLENIYEIDRLCMSFERIAEFDLKLENYLTFAYVKRPDLSINSSKFQLTNSHDNEVFDRMFTDKNNNVYYSDLLNRRQRKAVLTSLDGDSFSIVGHNGTGKTTTLKNILINAMNQGKRTLFISNMKETLDDVEKFLEDKGLGKYVANFSNSFASLFEENDTYIEKNSDLEVSYETLKENYDYINDFEKKMSGRILDHRFIEVLDELSYLSLVDPKSLVLDDLSHIYKHEFEEIVNKLETIQEALNKMESFKNSVWREIPILNSIIYPEQIISLIKRIYNCFLLFADEKKILQNKFDVKNIDNYAMFKNIIHHIESLNIDLVPESWKEESLSKFHQAKDEYKNLKNDIYGFQEVEYYLNHKYVNIDSISIKNELSLLLGEYFTEDDLTTINSILENRSNLTARINRGLYQKENYEKSVQILEEFSNWEFSDDNGSVWELLRLSDFLNSHNISRRWINIISNNQYDKVYGKLIECIETIEDKTREIQRFNETYPKLTNINYKELVKSIDEYNSLSDTEKKDNKVTAALKKKLGSSDLESITYKVKSHFNDIRALKQAKDEYYDLVKEKYTSDTDVCEKLRDLKEYISNIKNKTIYTNIIKFLYKLCEKDNSNKEENSRIVRTLNNFRKAFFELEDLISVLTTYKISFKEKQYSKKNKEIEKAVDYLRNLYASNDRMKNIVKIKENNYVNAEMYVLLDRSLERKANIRNRLSNNQEYISLYGKLYQEEKTDITMISRLLQNFQSFCDCFANSKGFIRALEKKINEKLLSHLEVCIKTSDEINEIFKLYCRIFKDGVSRYYYTSFEENIKYLEKLLNSKEELLIYLTITKGIVVLNKYKLGKLINYIINDKKVGNLVDDFKYTYYKNIERMYYEKYPELKECDKVLEKLDEIIVLEKKLIIKNEEAIISSIRRNSSNKSYTGGAKNLDYQGFVRKTNGLKHVFLTTSDISNMYLDKEAFDLIIIDDAHLLAANEYGDFVNGEQVIVAGEYQFHSSISNSLISRTRNSSTITLDYRYLPMPKNLQKYCKELSGIIQKEASANVGLEIIENDLYGYLYSLYEKDKNITINYYTKGLRKQRDVFENVVNYFFGKGVTREEIVDYLMTKINISDLSDGYLYHADYNIIDFEDYYDINVDYISDNMIGFLLLCKKKLVIHDENSLLEEKNNYRFFKMLEQILEERKETFTHSLTNKVMDKLSSLLEDENVSSYCDKDNLIYKVKDGSEISSVMVIWGNNSPTATLNLYRDIYVNYMKNGWDIKVVTKNHLVNDLKNKAMELK